MKAVLVLAAAATAFAQQWTVKADIPQHVYGHSGAAVNGKIHLLGGCPTPDWQKVATLHQIYNPAKDAWTTGRPLPRGAAWGMPAVWKGKIYFFGGGWNKPGQGITSSDLAWVYDPKTDAWSKIRKLPEVRMNGFAAAVGEYIYISQGYNRQGPSYKGVVEEYRSTWRYDPAKNTYTRVADAPVNGCYIASGVHKGKIYSAPGAYDEYGFHGEYTWADGALMYDPAANRWTKIEAPRVRKRVFFLTQCSASVLENGRLWLVGGMGENRQRTETTEYLDVEKGVFVRGPDIPFARCCGGGGFANGALTIVGGFVGTADTSKPALPAWVLK